MERPHLPPSTEQDSAQPAPRPDAANVAEGGTLVEPARRLSESELWRIQRRYFEREGINAWRSATVPHYITNNPALAEAFARVVLGYLRDADVASARGPCYIVELGAGSGRFGYLFLQAFARLRALSPLRDAEIRYVMTDFTEANVSFWRSHPALRPWIERGQLDFALVDVEAPGDIALLESGVVLRPGGLDTPLVLLANYVFDGVPQDAFVARGGRLHECLATIELEQPDADLAGPDPFSQLRLRFSTRPVEADYYPEPAFNELLRHYVATLEGAVIPFPAVALRCVEQFASLARGRLLLVSSDKGCVHPDALAELREPDFVVHGSVSMSVNYHAFAEWFRGRGGSALCTEHRQESLHVAAFVLGEPASRAEELRFAYHLAFERGSCDDFFRLRRGVQAHYGALDFEPLLALIRLSGYDPRILRDCAGVLRDKAGGLTRAQSQDLARAISHVWENYFHIGEPEDVPFGFAVLLHALGDHAGALALFRESLHLYGEDARTYWNMALCAVALGRSSDAAQWLSKAAECSTKVLSGAGLLLKDD